MTRYISKLLIILLLVSNSQLNAQKIVSDAMLIYELHQISIDNTAQDFLNGAKLKISLSSNKSVSELLTSLGSETTYYNAITGKGAVLKSYSGQKLLYYLNADHWKEKTKQFRTSSIEQMPGTKNISGYLCQSAIVKITDQNLVTVYYSPSVQMVNTQYDYAFPAIKGLPVQIEMKTGQSTIVYTLLSASFESQPAAVFNIPSGEGYRTMKFR